MFDRKRLLELFGYEYILEMYKPKAARRWGYSPCRSCTAIVSSESSTPPQTAAAGVLVVHAIHEDVKFTRAMIAGVKAELADLAAGLGLAAIEAA